MELILDCYFDNIFCQLERSSLMVRYKRRQLVDYLNTVIQGCINAEDCNEETGACRAVMAALRYHSSTKHSNGAVCLMGKYHNILYIAAKLCYDWKVNDNPTVVTLLNDIYHCERTFERLFIGAIFGTRVTHLISGWKSDFATPEENLSAIEYFLQHAMKGKLEYEIDGEMVRFIDIPMESYGRVQPLKQAAQFFRDQMLLLLLRYGAIISMEFEEDESPIEPLLRQFNTACEADLPLNRTGSALSCLRILLRAVPSLNTITYCSDDDDETRVLMDTKSVFGPTKLLLHPRLFEEEILPPSRSGINPPELKHLSRCVIRDVLRKNWQLPMGIRSLEIPLCLQDYLDLMED